MSARIPASNEPERPLAAASTHFAPVLEDAHETMTALAEPEPEQIETIDSAELETPQPAETEPSGSAMIVFEDVQKIYEPNVTALEGVSFTIEKGEFVFVVGASGSGKSTVIRLILKELEPSKGRILVGGGDV